MQVGGNELHKQMPKIVRSHNDELSRDTSFGILVVRHKTSPILHLHSRLVGQSLRLRTNSRQRERTNAA